MKVDKFSAITFAASFPDGNINPCNKSKIVILSYGLKKAEVPEI